MKNLFKKLTFLSIAMLVFGCSKDDTPKTTDVIKTKYKITSVVITQMPFTKPGTSTSWDVINGPDVYMGLFINNDTSLYDVSATLNNVTSSYLPIQWNLSTPYQTTNFNDPIWIWVVDNDTNDVPSTSDEVIGTIAFNMLQYTIGTNKYPSSVTETYNGVTVKLNLIWE